MEVIMRESGILFPVFSLASRYGIGCISKEAYEFVDFLEKSGQGFWQILPVGPTGYGDSPYQPFSAFAGNPYFICLETLIEEGLLTREECDGSFFGSNEEKVDYGALYQGRFPLLKKAYDRFMEKKLDQETDYQDFLKKEDFWLKDYALYMALKEKMGGKSWQDWAEPFRSRDAKALKKAEAAQQTADAAIATAEAAQKAADAAIAQAEASQKESADNIAAAEQAVADAQAAQKAAEDKAAETAETADEKAADTTGEKKEPSSGKGGTIAIVILSLILVALLVLIGLKFFVPGFMADSNTAVTTAAAMDRTEYDGDLNGVIQTQLDKNYGEEIEVIKYDSSWKAKGMTGTEKIEDNVLFKEKDGTLHYVDETVVGTVIAYESRMQAMDQNGDLKVLDYIKDGTELRAATEAVLSTSTYEPMKSLTFGKIRQTADGDYAVWVREEKTKVTEKILTLEADGAKMKVTAEEIL